MFEDLSLDTLSCRASGPDGWPVASSAQQLLADPIAMLVQTYALTSSSLQQVAEGLTSWKDAEKRHRSKNWQDGRWAGPPLHRLEEGVESPPSGELPGAAR